MTAGSSHIAIIRATGTPVPASAAITRCSRSTACADGSSLPGRLAPQHVTVVAGRHPVGRIRLPALELQKLERTAEVGDMRAQVRGKRGLVERVQRRDELRPDVCGIGHVRRR